MTKSKEKDKNSDFDWDDEDLVYDAQGRVKCPKCGKWVALGNGKLGQLKIRHIPSKECRKARTKGFGNLMQMFGKKTKAPTTASTVKQPAATPMEPLEHEQTLTLPPPTTPQLIQPADNTPHVTLESTRKLLAAISSVIDVADGAGNDYLSKFSQPPQVFDDESLTADELFETRLNDELHSGVRWGDGVAEERFRGLTRDAVYGFVHFVEYFVVRGVGEGVFAARIDTLVEGIERWRVQAVNQVQHESQTATPRVEIPPIDSPTPAVDATSHTIVLDEPDSSNVSISQAARGTPISAALKTPRIVNAACMGYRLPVPAGLSPYSSYPHGLHDVRSLPWNYAMENGSMVLTSWHCERRVDSTKYLACKACRSLANDTRVVGILERMRDGVKEGTVWAYHGVSSLVAQLKKKNTQIEFFRLRGLNQARKLLTAASTLSDYKRFLSAVASKKIERVDRIIRLGLRHKQGIQAMLGAALKAASGLYKPKDYQEEDYMRAIVLWKLGGDRIASIAHRAFGLPAITTLRNQLRIPPIIPSPAMPTIIEVAKNTWMTFEGLLEALVLGDRARCVHAVLMFDEIACEKRIRWDPKTNKFLGICREHAHCVAQEFTSEKDMEVLFGALDRGDVHYAAEATIGAVGVLSNDNRVYASRVILISGDCKREVGPQHANLILNTLAGLNTHQKDTNIRVVSIASDGESRRGAALAELTFKKALNPSSPIYAHLNPLSFMNLHVGDDDVTADKDWKHVLKRLRNLLLRQQGTVVGGVRITPSMLKSHLKAEGVPTDHIRAITNPEDKQDVKLAFDLLRAIWSLPRLPTASTNPGVTQARDSIWILGRFLYHTVFPYLCVDLSLAEQLEHLSAASHLALALYKMEGKDFLPTQLYTDIQIMIKNVFFCVSKAKVDTPKGSFWIILLGTDRLEQTFGDLRTMIGNDANLDILQVSWRVGSTAEVANILAKYPHWDRPPRRLTIPMLTRDMSVISTAMDHLKPRNWRGDTRVEFVNLQTCWRSGRSIAEGVLSSMAKLFKDLESTSSTKPIDILAPNGDLLVKVPLSEDDTEGDGEDEIAGEDLEDSEASVVGELSALNADARIEVEDEAGILGEEEDVMSEGGGSPDAGGTFSRTIVSNGKTLVKSRALAAYSRFRKVASSTDRLKRVQHIQRYSSTVSSTTSLSPDPLGGVGEDTEVLLVHDPIVTLLCCENRVWVCIGEVNAIRVDGTIVEEVSKHLLVEDYVSISFQLLGLRSSNQDEDPSGKYDWRTCAFPETTFSIPGRYVKAINPSIALLPDTPSKLFYLLDSGFLTALGASLYSRLSIPDLKTTPKVVMTKEFPYREAGGKACFLCEDERRIEGLGQANMIECEYCSPPVALDASQAKKVLEHAAAHILHDPKVKSIDQPCGICLRPSPICRFYLEKSKGAMGGDRIDQRRSNCKYELRFHYSKAAKSTASAPCTNIPIRCPACSAKDSPAVWKYNIEAHFKQAHPNCSIADFPELDWRLTNFERSEMKERWKRRGTTGMRRAKKADASSVLTISDAHVSGGGLRPLNSDVLDINPDAPSSRIPQDLESDVSGEDDERSMASEDDAPMPDNEGGSLEAQLQEGGFWESSDEYDEGAMPNSAGMSMGPTVAIPGSSTQTSGTTESSQGPSMAEGQSVLTPSATATSVATPAASTSPPTLSLNIAGTNLAPLTSTLKSHEPGIGQSEATHSGMGQLEHVAPASEESAAPSTSGTQAEGRRSTRTRAKRVLELDVCIYGEIAGPRDMQRRPSVQCTKLGCETVWYHLRETCIDLEIAPNGWVCPACLANEGYGAANEGGRGAKAKRRRR